MPQERIADKVKVIHLVGLSLENLIDLAFDNLGFEDGSLKIDRVRQVHLTIVNKVMRADKRLDGLLHRRNIKVISGKEILVRPFRTPVSSIEIVTDLLAGQNTDVLREDGVEHRTVLDCLMGIVLF